MHSANQRFEAIDIGKFAASLLVVAIHTGPLLSINAFADFLLTSVMGRLAVPFFFAASGFLFFRKLTGNVPGDNRTVRRYVGKIATLYMLSMMLYLPLNIYKGDFQQGFSIASFIRDLFIDGTFYHLWYLPALLIGLVIVFYLQRYLSLSWVLIVTLGLYTIGLLGDGE